MADKDLNPKLAALRSLEASLIHHRSAVAKAARSRGQMRRSRWRTFLFRLLRWARPVLIFVAIAEEAILAAFDWARDRLRRGRFFRRIRDTLSRWWRRPAIRIGALVTGGTLLAFAIGLAGLWWRLTAGPISFDIATPWLTAAIDENLGDHYRVEIGGTVIELDESRRMAVRMRDVAVRDRNGTIVASAPKAEAGFSAASALFGRPRAESINLVGAEVGLRVETDGTIAIFAGADERPIATSPVLASADAAPPLGAAVEQTGAVPGASDFGAGFAALLAWIDSLGTVGLDGGHLTQLGLKSGNLVVDDLRNGRQSRLENIHFSLTRPEPGELSVTLGSKDPSRPWVIVAAVKPTSEGARAVRLEARKVSIHDLLLASRLDAGRIDTDMPLSASLRAEVAADGTPNFASGRILIGPGMIGETGHADGRITIDRLEANLEWDAARRAIVSPFQLISGNTRMTLIARAEAPIEAGGSWKVGVRGGSVVISPQTADEDPLLINRILIRGEVDPVKRRLEIRHAEAAGMDVNVAMSGFVDFTTSDPRLVIGMAARNMSGNSFKRIWPPFVNPQVRSWVLENMAGGTVEQAEVATNTPLSSLREGGPPVPDDGLSINLAASGTAVRVAEGLPPIRDTDLLMTVRGRRATIALGSGVVRLPSGRRLTLTNGVFNVPDTYGDKPPAKVRVRANGAVSTVAELLAMEPFRKASGAPLDPAASRGTVDAQISLAMLLDPEPPEDSLEYKIVGSVTNFAVDRFLMSKKIEAQTLRISADNEGYELRGEVRIADAPATVEYRKATDEPDAEVRLQAVFDDEARHRFGFDTKGGLSGPVSVELAGRLGASAAETNRFAVQLDLTQAKIDNLLPGWIKEEGSPSRANFNYVANNRVARLTDLTLEGSGAAVKGEMVISGEGELIVASFPAFGLSEGDKASLKVERGGDGLYKITARGEVFDGRSFVKSVMGGSTAEAKERHAMADFDLDLKVGALVGFNGEALRAVELRILLREGGFEDFVLNAKIGADTDLIGDMRDRIDGGDRVVYFETKDAGALFRFTDTYARMFGGHMWVALEPPSGEPVPREGLLNVRDFVVRGEPSLDRIVSGAPGRASPGVDFTRMRVEFTRAPGQLAIGEGVVRGPVIGATIKGVIDYTSNAVRMSGTFVPLYGLNNAFGQIPIVGLILGGGANEGLVGLTYEVVGTPGAPVLRVNPISALTPGVLRKFFQAPPGGMPNQRYLDTRSSIQ